MVYGIASGVGICNLSAILILLKQQFAGIVSQVDQLRKKQGKNERELEQLFQSLLQRYFG